MAKSVAGREDLTIGGLAKRTGTNIETIRYYERVGLLAPPQRNSGNRRVYLDADLRNLTFIRRSRELGFKLDDIRTLLGLGAPERATCSDVRAIAARHLASVRAKLNDLREVEKVLSDAVAQCSGLAVNQCAVIDVLDTEKASEIGRQNPEKSSYL